MEFQKWLKELPGSQLVLLFDADKNLRVQTQIKHPNRRLLCRSCEMEDAIVHLVQHGLVHTTWQGMLYIMGKKHEDHFIPLYVGAVNKQGRVRDLNSDFENIETNRAFFTRWGDSLYYHIGDLSREMFGFEAKKKKSEVHLRWAKALFLSFDPPVLKESVYLYIAPWYIDSRNMTGSYCTLNELRKQIFETYRGMLLQDR